MGEKKIDEETDTFFPELAGGSARAKEYYSILKNRALFGLEKVAGQDREKEIEDADRRLLLAVKPEKYSGPQGLEVKMINAYEDNCIAISQFLSRDPKAMTALEYRRAIRMLERQAKEHKNGKNTHGKPN